jgi:hypothetical protein
MSALESGADVVLAGRASDTATVAAIALMRGAPAGPTWHAAKTVECGALCTTDPTTGGVFVEIDESGFTVVPLMPTAACTPTSVAAHMLYENADPYRLVEPTGELDTSQATYVAADDRTVRVEGSRFIEATQPTIKIEGARQSGYETIALVGIRDPKVIANIDTWVARVKGYVEDRIRDTLKLEPDQYRMELRRYGYDGVLGQVEGDGVPAREICIMFKVLAQDQATATSIAKTANPVLLHMPLQGRENLPSYAFATSPAEIERGSVHEFVLNHVIRVGSADELFRIESTEVGNG